MSRHGRKVPTTFYHRFTEDACAFADRFAQGRLVSVLEGGYSDRALTSGAMSHLCGLAHMGDDRVDEKWWSVENLEKVRERPGSCFVSLTHSISPSSRKLPKNAAVGGRLCQLQVQ